MYYEVCTMYIHTFQYRPIWKGSRGRILGHNWDKSLKEFSSLLFTVTSTNGFTPLPPRPLSKSGLKLVCNVSKNSQDYAQKPQRNRTLMNSASGG
jgi:hypothetical protein